MIANWHVAAILVCCLMQMAKVEGQNDSVISLLGRETTILTSGCDSDNQCQCTIEAPRPCSYDVEYAELLRVREQLDLVFEHVNGAVLQRVEASVSSLTARLTTLEASLHNQSISVSITELAGLQDQVRLILGTLTQIAQNSSSAVTQHLTTEVEAIRDRLQILGTRNPIAVKADLDKEIATLRARLTSCSTAVATHKEAGLDFLGDGLPANHTINADACPATYNITVGEPVTYKYRNVPGMWLKDPLPVSEAEKTRIYETRHSYTINQKLYYYKTLDDYESKNFLSKATPSLCAFNIYGQKPLHLGGSWYWFDGYSSNRNLHKIRDLWTPGCDYVTGPLKFPNINFDYNGHIYNDVDLNFDETGLYVVYADVNGNLNIMKINKDSLHKEKNWNTGKKKASVAGTFMVCGRLYSYDDAGSRHLTIAQWGYDTAESKEFFFNLDVESKFGDIQALSYNPREKALFGWDNGHAVLYPVFL